MEGRAYYTRGEPKQRGLFNSVNQNNPGSSAILYIEILFFGAPKSLQMVTATMKLKDAYSLEEML